MWKPAHLVDNQVSAQQQQQQQHNDTWRLGSSGSVVHRENEVTIH